DELEGTLAEIDRHLVLVLDLRGDHLITLHGVTHLRRLCRECFAAFGIKILSHRGPRTLMVDDRGWGRKYKMIRGVIIMGFRVDQEDDGFVSNFLYRGQHFAGVQWAVAAIDHHDAFLGDDEAARRGRRVGSKDVDTVFDLREPRTEFLGLKRKSDPQD